jgi:hypothetical protein
MQSVVKSMSERNGGEGGSVIVTGATSSTRGREGFAGFAASKSGLRAICQSVAREYGPKVSEAQPRLTLSLLLIRYPCQNIHIAHVIVDGLIESQQAIDHFGMEKGSRFPDGSVCTTYLYSLSSIPNESSSSHRRFDQRKCARHTSSLRFNISLLGPLKWTCVLLKNTFDDYNVVHVDDSGPLL